MSGKKLEPHDECKEILSRLIDIVKNCQTKYGGKKELASESDELVIQLCEIWEEVVSFGLKNINKTSVFNEFADVFKLSGNNEYSFWDFCQTHLTQHERKRFEELNHVWTNRGRTKSFLRNALNEQSLQRSLSMWLSDPTLNNIYESWSLMIDSESTNLLTSIAGGLNSILFAIAIDTPEINSLSKFRVKHQEPIISAPTPVGPSKKTMPIKRNIVSFNDNEIDDVGQLLNAQQASSELYLSSSSPSTSFRDKVLSNSSEIIFNEQFEKEENRQDNSQSEVDLYLNSLSQITIVNDDGDDSNVDDPVDFIESESISNTSKSTSSSILNNTSSYLPVECCSHSNFKNMEEELRIMTERCVFLEARVAELSLENRRLQRLGNFLNNDFGNYVVTIPKTNLITTHRSSYYEYEIHITSREQESWVVCKRYSEFNKFHATMLKKHYPLVKAIDFPPKKKIGNMNFCFVEERRLRLQTYLRHLLEVLPEILLCTSKEELQGVLSFFK